MSFKRRSSCGSRGVNVSPPLVLDGAEDSQLVEMLSIALDLTIEQGDNDIALLNHRVTGELEEPAHDGDGPVRPTDVSPAVALCLLQDLVEYSIDSSSGFLAVCS